MPTPRSVTWFPNGMAVVGDENGRQMPEFGGRHDAALAAFKQAGIDWRSLPDTCGQPLSKSQLDWLWSVRYGGTSSRPANAQ